MRFVPARRPPLFPLLSALAIAAVLGAGAAPRPAPKKPARPAPDFRNVPQVKMALPAELAVPPKPAAQVLVRLPDRRRIPFADWLKLFGRTFEGTTEGPKKKKPFDGTWGEGDANAKEGTLEVFVNPLDSITGSEKQTAALYWDYTYTGTEIIDVDLLAAIPYHRPFCNVGGDSENSGGGGTAIVSVYLGAEDRSNGAVSETIIYDQYMTGTAPPPFAYKRVTESDHRLALRLHPGRSYRFYVKVYASAEVSQGSNKTRGTADAMDQITVESLALFPTNGPRIETTVDAQFPYAYDTYDVYEQILQKVAKKPYFPVVGEIHVAIGGQYAVKDSWIRITLRGGGRLTLLRPDLADEAGLEVSQAGDNTIQLVPPPLANPTGTLDFYLPVMMDTELDPTVWKLGPGDQILSPLKKMWSRLDPRLPEKPAIVLPNSKFVNLMDLGYWFVVMPAEEAGIAFQESPCKALAPVPVLYACPPGKKAAAPKVAGWQVREVEWEKLAPPSLKDSGAPLVALNLAALADLPAALAPAEVPGNGAKASSAPAAAPAGGAKKAPAKGGPQPVPAEDSNLMRLVPSAGNRGFYQGKPWDQQALFNRLETTFVRWIRDSKIGEEDRLQLVLYVADDGEVITGKSLLEKLGEKNALAALKEGLSDKQADRKYLVIYKASDGEFITGEALFEDILAGTVKEPTVGARAFRILKAGFEAVSRGGTIYLAVPHLNLYGKDFALHVKGVAANGTFAKCTSEDELGFKTYFDFIPRRARDVHPLTPHLRGAAGAAVPSESTRP